MLPAGTSSASVRRSCFHLALIFPEAELRDRADVLYMTATPMRTGTRSLSRMSKRTEPIPGPSTRTTLPKSSPRKPSGVSQSQPSQRRARCRLLNRTEFIDEKKPSWEGVAINPTWVSGAPHLHQCKPGLMRLKWLDWLTPYTCSDPRSHHP
jgi:hypothetical protein